MRFNNVMFLPPKSRLGTPSILDFGPHLLSLGSERTFYVHSEFGGLAEDIRIFTRIGRSFALGSKLGHIIGHRTENRPPP